MRQRLLWIVFNVLALTVALLPAVADAQGFGRDSRGSQRREGAESGGPPAGSSAPRSSGGFNIQIGPGGLQFGTGNDPGWGGQNPQQPNSPRGGFNNPGSNNNWNNNNWNRQGWNRNDNNWNNNTWVGPGRPPVVVQPQPTFSVPPGPPSPPAEPIVLVNPAGSPAPVQYRVNQYSYVLPPGSTQQLGGDRVWSIDYDRGSNYGRQSYTLTPGRTYRFTPGPRGWELFVVAPAAPPVLGQ